jgi:hypothetical protein
MTINEIILTLIGALGWILVLGITIYDGMKIERLADMVLEARQIADQKQAFAEQAVDLSLRVLNQSTPKP